MLVVKTWCLPHGLFEEQYRHLHEQIVSAVISVKGLGIKGERDMLNLFPKDLMSYGLGSEIFIEVLYQHPNYDIKYRLAKALVEVVKSNFPKAYVECFIPKSQEFDINIHVDSSEPKDTTT